MQAVYWLSGPNSILPDHPKGNLTQHTVDVNVLSVCACIIFSPLVSVHLEALKTVETSVTMREKRHIIATRAFASGSRPKAAEAWRAILIDNPKGRFWFCVLCASLADRLSTHVPPNSEW